MYVMYVFMDAWMRGCMDGWMHGCMDGWMHGCMDGWMDVWMYVSIYICICLYNIYMVYNNIIEVIRNPSHPLL